jgi:uncharacterized coiled-coil protein SlyX
MAHERDDNKYDGQEDGEYHFSDDQGGYESEPEITPTKAAPAAAAPTVAVPLKDRINQYRKQLIGVGVFFLLIFLVYKISAPSGGAAPNTDFAQNAGTIPTQKPVMKQLPKAIKVAQTQPAQSDFQPLPQAAGMSTASPSTSPAPVQQPVLTEVQSTPGMPESATAAPPPPVPETTATVTPSISSPNMAGRVPAENYYNPAQPNPVAGDKLTSLEQQNAKQAAEYAQKLAEQQAQNAALQNQVQDLTQRLASMETTLAHLGRMIQDLKPGSASSRPDTMSAGPIEQTAQNIKPTTAPSGDPKSVYSVQAIIPGRAWLKADNGETVTVAEGDILKNYGRIMKIDPYDGIVQIDTGSHIMNLAYGVSTD